MPSLFSKSNLAFYDQRLKRRYVSAGTWPADCVELTDDQYSKFTKAPPDGFKLGADDRGMPAWVPVGREHLRFSAMLELDNAVAAVSDYYYKRPVEYSIVSDGLIQWRSDGVSSLVSDYADVEGVSNDEAAVNIAEAAAIAEESVRRARVIRTACRKELADDDADVTEVLTKNLEKIRGLTHG